MKIQRKSTGRLDPRDAVRRDAARIARRATNQHRFWQSLSVLGTVGWPIALLTVAGTAIGHWLDLRWGTGVRMTLILMTLGVTIGSLSAWKSIAGYRDAS
ncbi:MAG: AtpZ/AtpI family protein [Planctomycetales bacterium]|nr:AtpZ/AtpI family protein [Planctomycetales bacterium]